MKLETILSTSSPEGQHIRAIPHDEWQDVLVEVIDLHRNNLIDDSSTIRRVKCNGLLAILDRRTNVVGKGVALHKI